MSISRTTSDLAATVGRRTILKAAAGLLVAASPFPKPALAQPVKVRYTLSWLPTGQYAFVYMARQLGFWKKRGLDVEISRGSGSMGAIQGVVGDKFDAGGAATGALILSRTRGLDLRIVGTQGYDSYMGILAPTNGSIRGPKDLEGRTIGVTAAGGDTPFLPAYCKLAGIDYQRLNVVSLDSQIIEQAVIRGQVDAMVAFAMSSIPNFITQNFPVRLLRFSDVGLQFYWVNTFTRGDYLEKNESVVAAIQEGLAEALKWTMLNPEEAVERHLKEHEELAATKNGKLFTELGVGMISACNIAPESLSFGLGHTDLGKIDAQADLVKAYTAKPDDPPPPTAQTYVRNLTGGAVRLSADEWEIARAKSRSYAALLGQV